PATRSPPRTPPAPTTHRTVAPGGAVTPPPPGHTGTGCRHSPRPVLRGPPASRPLSSAAAAAPRWDRTPAGPDRGSATPLPRSAAGVHRPSAGGGASRYAGAPGRIATG